MAEANQASPPGVVKHKRGDPLNSGKKTVILNVFNTFCRVGMLVNSSQWESRRPPKLRNVSMRLGGADLWQKFHALTNEMIITKTGRNMFPVPIVNVSGLDPEALYYIIMEVFLASDRQFKFVGYRWKAAGKAKQQIEASSRLYIHPDSPDLGSHWMREPISMKTAKLSNNTMSKSGHIILTSKHKYIPRFHVVQTSDIRQLHCSPTATFSYPATEFIAVTAYQNDQVTKLKINHNPFATGFREDGPSHMKRKKKSESGAKQKPLCSKRSSESPVEAAPATTTSTGPAVMKINININPNTIHPYTTRIYSSDALVRSSVPRSSEYPVEAAPATTTSTASVCSHDSVEKIEEDLSTAVEINISTGCQSSCYKVLNVPR